MGNLAGHWDWGLALFVLPGVAPSRVGVYARLGMTADCGPARPGWPQYMDLGVTNSALAGLNGLPLGKGILTVVKATPDAPLQVSQRLSPALQEASRGLCLGSPRTHLTLGELGN